MIDAIRHLDKRLSTLRPLTKSARPPKGWLRAVRDALGMTTAQLARRMGVTQPRIIELEQAEVSGGGGGGGAQPGPPPPPKLLAAVLSMLWCLIVRLPKSYTRALSLSPKSSWRRCGIR
jgi:hypothetical protein